jgi:hypothetical protein
LDRAERADGKVVAFEFFSALGGDFFACDVGGEGFGLVLGDA